MRTTVAIDDELLQAAKQRAAERGQTLGSVVEEALRRELGRREGTPVALPVFTGGTGPAPGVDLLSNRALHELLDEDTRETVAADVLLYDVNVLLAAYRQDHPQHAQARAELASTVQEGLAFTVPLTVWVALLRLATDRRVFPVPSPVRDVFAFVAAVRAQPGHVPSTLGERHLALLERACTESGAVGSLVADASLAAQALELGAEVVTFDRDFGRFAVRSRILRPS